MDELKPTPLPSNGDPLLGDPASVPATPPGQEGGLGLPQLENMFSDIRFQPVWRQEASKCADYYDGNQLTQERLQRMERLGIPPLVTNLIRPAVDAVLGLEVRTRTDWRVTEEDDGEPVPEPMLDALNYKLTNAKRETHADRAISDAYAAQIKAGLGWVEVSRATDAMMYPYRVSYVHRDEIWWDWRAKRPDLLDCRYLIRKRRFDQDELIAHMPEYQDLIKNAIQGSFRTWQWEATARDQYDPVLTYAAEVERITNLDDTEWRDAERRRATLFEAWYRMWKRGLLLRLPNNKIIPFDQNNLRHQVAVQSGMIQPFQGTYTELRVAFYLGPHRLYDFKSPYPHNYFPYVPFWGFREDKTGVPYGLVRSMVSPQDVVNSADAKMHWMLNARRLIASSDAIDVKHNSWRQVQDELARPDSVVLLDPAKPAAKFEVNSDFQLNQQQFQRRQQAAGDIENAGGVFRSMMGKANSGDSGVLVQSLVEQGSVTLAEINDNAMFARRQVGEMLFCLVREDMIGKPMELRIPSRMNPRRKVTVPLNQPQDNGVLMNNVALASAKVVLTDVPATTSFRAQQLMVLSEVVKSLPPQLQAVAGDVLLKLTDVPDKDLLIERWRHMTGIQDLTPEQQDAAQEQAQQAQAQAAQLATAGQQTAIEVNQAKAEKLRAETQKIIEETQGLAAVLQEQLAAAQNGGADPEAIKYLQDELGKAGQQVQQLQQALHDQHEKLAVHAALEQNKIDNAHSIAQDRLASEHVRGLAKIAVDAQLKQNAMDQQDQGNTSGSKS